MSRAALQIFWPIWFIISARLGNVGAVIVVEIFPRQSPNDAETLF
nr:hypothetical protein CSF007_p0165 [Yersinia ruckeri]